jgi:hypothetical protein
MTTRARLSAAAVAAAILIVAPLALTLAAQQPPLSPPGTASVKIGAATITIDYGRPSIRGRKIMGGLVPYDKVWRTGANAATTLKTDAALDLGGAVVPAGTYTIYSWPGEKAWKLIVNKQTGQWGTQYDEKQDLARVDLKVEVLPAPVELFTITLAAAGANAGTLTLEWESTRLSVPVKLK